MSYKGCPALGREEWNRWFNFDDFDQGPVQQPAAAGEERQRRWQKGKDSKNKNEAAEDKKEKDKKTDPDIALMNVDDDKKSEASVRTTRAGDGSLVSELPNLLKSMKIPGDEDPVGKAIKQVVYSEGKNHRVLIDTRAAH